jgi:hypothetical protein
MNEKMEQILKNLRAKRMDAYFVETAAEVRPLVESLLPAGATIAVGGSESLAETGVLDLVRSGNYRFIDRYAPDLSEEEREERLRAGLLADVFLCSSNAVTEAGELVNVDGRSNRCAALLYGPKQVILVVGANKLVRDVAAGLARVKAVAAPKNAVRLSCNTACRRTGHCVADESDLFGGCASEARICCNYVISSYQRQKGRIKVILCGESLGY